MASDYLLEIDGIKGESQDDKHKGTIDIESFSWGVSQTGTATRPSGGSAGKPVFQDIHFSSRLNSASPQLFLSCATGQHIKKASLYVRKSGGEQRLEYYKISLEDVIIASYDQSGDDGGEVPSESFSLNFAKIELDYTPTKSDGGAGSSVKAGYDLKLNRKV